jgi:hypothetical protein
MPFLSTTFRLRLDYHVTLLFSSTHPDRSFFIPSSPLFSITHPDRPSFLTSFWVSAPFLILMNALVSRAFRRTAASLRGVTVGFLTRDIATSRIAVVGPNGVRPPGASAARPYKAWGGATCLRFLESDGPIHIGPQIGPRRSREPRTCKQPPVAFLAPVLRATSQTRHSLHPRLALIAGVMSRPQYRI